MDEADVCVVSDSDCNSTAAEDVPFRGSQCVSWGEVTAISAVRFGGTWNAWDRGLTVEGASRGEAKTGPEERSRAVLKIGLSRHCRKPKGFRDCIFGSLISVLQS